MQGLIGNGFMGGIAPLQQHELGKSEPIYVRRNAILGDPNIVKAYKDIKRMSREHTGDYSQLLTQLNLTKATLERAVTSSGWSYATSGPVRENLEAEAKILVPMDTPMRNRLPRTPGSGLASKWKTLTSLGGGYGVNTTGTTGVASATQTLGSTAGMVAGDTIYFATAAVSRVVQSITSATVVVFTASVTSTTNEVVTKILFEPGTGAGASQAFFGEQGAPAVVSSVYADNSAAYKLLGHISGVSGFAAAAGASFQNQMAVN